MKKVLFQVVDDMDEVNLSPLFREDFKFLQIPVSEYAAVPFKLLIILLVRFICFSFTCWSGFVRSNYNVLQYTGKYVIPRGSKIRVCEPGTGHPFMTAQEYRNKFREDPPEYTDEELTRDYDRDGE